MLKYHYKSVSPNGVEFHHKCDGLIATRPLVDKLRSLGHVEISLIEVEGRATNVFSRI